MPNLNNKLPISAMVVVFNEASLLEKCLASIDFCDEIVVYDLGSTDDSRTIARSHGAKVRTHKRVLHAELIYADKLAELKYDWILVTDPDEQIDSKLAKNLMDNFSKLPKTTAVVRAPMQYFFKSKPLRGTIWGGISNRQLLVNRKRAYFRPLVNTPIAIEKGFKVYRWPYSGGVVNHYWMNSYRQFIAKHRRYLSREGKARYERGERVGYIGILRSPMRSFWDSFISKKGYLDGWVGFMLSLFWAWYNTSALIKLKRMQLKKKFDG